VKGLTGKTLFLILLFGILCFVLPARADLTIRTDGTLQKGDHGLKVSCDPLDDIEVGQSIRVFSSFVGNTRMQDIIRDNSVSVNGQLCFFSEDPSFEYTVPYDVWRLYMTDDTHVEVHTVIRTDSGNVYADLRLELKEPVVPLCENHRYRFCVDTDRENGFLYWPCSQDPDRHYLAGCYGYNECTVCGERTESEYYMFDEEQSPEITPHVFDGGRCIAHGCGAEETGPRVMLTAQDHGRWVNGNEYTVEVTCLPADTQVDDLEWGFTYKSIYTKESEDDASCGRSVIEIVSSEGNRCTFRATEVGQAMIVAVINSLNKQLTCCVDVKDEASEDIDIDRYYSMLNALEPGDNPMNHPFIERMIRTELEEAYGQYENAPEVIDGIISRLKDSETSDTYRDLFIWSLFDYTKDTESVYGISYHAGGRVVILPKGGLDVWLHEIGHAVEYNLYNQVTTKSDRYKENMYTALYYSVYNMISNKVLDAAKGSGLTNEERFEIIEYIMGDEYSVFNQDYLRDFFRITASAPALVDWTWLTSVTGQKAPDQFSEKQKDVFNSALSAMKEFLQPMTHSNAAMLNDMVSGCTNQVGEGDSFFTVRRAAEIYGHGPLKNQINEAYDKDYWYKNGVPTYMQNLEAWAEYFSSQITGICLEDNQRYFGEACTLMDAMAEELLEGYKLKHSN